MKQFEGKRVLLTAQDDEQVEGLAVSASDEMILFRPKGTTVASLYMAEDIKNVELVPEAPQPIKVRTLKPVNEKNVRQHLCDAHGYQPKDVEDWSAEDALTEHSALHENENENENENDDNSPFWSHVHDKA